MIIIIARPKKLDGELIVPGDKSITHRAVMIGSLARGTTEVFGFLAADDCRSTINCMRSLGVNITEIKERLCIEGRNMALQEPEGPLYAGNSGTTARLLLGVLAGQPFRSTITGDQSLSKRPMKRVVEPLSLMGAGFGESKEYLPVTINGGRLEPISYRTAQASAQLKSAVLLAGIYAGGETSIIEPAASRNHTELMLADFGAVIDAADCRVSVQGAANLIGKKIRVPGDISTAAFFMVAAAIVPGSEVLLKDVGINPTRSGVVDVLQQMGAAVELKNRRLWGMEPVADILIRGGAKLSGTTVAGVLIPRLIDEIPVLAVAAALADGKTVIRDAAELRVKESDRIAALAGELGKLGALVAETPDGMVIEGGAKLRGAKVKSHGDHRIAMALAIAGLAAEGDTSIDGAEAVAVSYPGFMKALRSLVVS